MKKIIVATALVGVLSGCATAWKTAIGNANNVHNGMTVDEVLKIIGTPASSTTSTQISWQRRNAFEYNGTPYGAIKYELQNGRVVNVPEGGIFNEKTAREIRAAKSEQRMAEYREKEAARAKMIADSIVICMNKVQCGKVFALAQVYATKVSDQKIQVATDSVIETYNPTEGGNVGLSITKTPTAGDSEQITITPVCKGSEYGINVDLCRQKIEVIYRGFKPFIESHLGQSKATGI